jgi:tetratricopeptide (TPR) repeat protein
MRRARRRLALAAGLACAALACAGSPAPPAEAPSPASGSLEPVLLDLGEEALARGDLDAAADRFRRVALARPGSARAQVGLGRVALRRGDAAAARGHFEAALAADPESADARLGLADVAERAGDAAGEREQLVAVLSREPGRADVHARHAALTGRAPAAAPATPQEAVTIADAHPYDTPALLRAADALAGDGQREAAVRVLERILWLGDVDARTSRAALARLRSLAPEWRERAVVEVRCFADDALRERPGWQFVIRDAWRRVSRTLRPALDVRFVPVAITPLRGAEASGTLEAIHLALLQRAQSARFEGILAGFTGREPPRAAGAYRQGVAQMLGRALTVRAGSEDALRRVLTHEVLHLYGAIHVAAPFESIMNPDGDTLLFDSFNLAIVRETARRRFGPGGIERQLLPYVDLERTIDAYVAAIGANLDLRALGLDRALALSRESRRRAAAELHAARQLDAHLGDMAWIVGEMMLRAGQRVQALVMWEAAAQLYGPRTRRGREAAESAERLREVLRRELL